MNTTMQSAMAVPLQIMQQVNSDMSTFTKTALYPLQQIQAAQSMATQGLQQSENMQGMINTSTASAKLPSPQQLEAAMLSKDPNQGANVSMLYQQTYGTLPTSQTAPSSVILAVDMGDAVAMASIKKAIALDALADSEMTVSQQLMNELQTTAPGNVPMIPLRLRRGYCRHTLTLNPARLSVEGAERRAGIYGRDYEATLYHHRQSRRRNARVASDGELIYGQRNELLLYINMGASSGRALGFDTHPPDNQLLHSCYNAAFGSL